jgi:hypothetical protein
MRDASVEGAVRRTLTFFARHNGLKQTPLKSEPLFFGGLFQMATVPSPVLIADKCTITFSAEADGKIRAVYQGWDDAKIVLPSQSIEIRRGPQGVEFRILGYPTGGDPAGRGGWFKRTTRVFMPSAPPRPVIDLTGDKDNAQTPSFVVTSPLAMNSPKFRGNGQTTPRLPRAFTSPDSL